MIPQKGNGHLWKTPLLLTFHWPKHSHLDLHGCKGGWENISSWVASCPLKMQGFSITKREMSKWILGAIRLCHKEKAVVTSDLICSRRKTWEHGVEIFRVLRERQCDWRLLYLIKSLCKDTAASHSHTYRNSGRAAHMNPSWENLLDDEKGQSKANLGRLTLHPLKQSKAKQRWAVSLRNRM